MQTDVARGMAKTRALLTETEREQLAGDHGNDRKYQATSRARRRIQGQLPADIEVMQEHQQDLLSELRGVVCSDGAAGDVDLDAVRDATRDARDAYESVDGDGIGNALDRLEELLDIEGSDG